MRHVRGRRGERVRGSWEARGPCCEGERIWLCVCLRCRKQTSIARPRTSTSQWYTEVAVSGGENLHNQVRPVRLTAVEDGCLRGEL